MDNPIIFTEDLPDSTVHDRAARGDLMRLAQGIYSQDCGRASCQRVR
jgi:hypothetical protein